MVTKYNLKHKESYVAVIKIYCAWILKNDSQEDYFFILLAYFVLAQTPVISFLVQAYVVWLDRKRAVSE